MDFGGSINDNYRNFIYNDNWKREVNEDYLPITLETMKKKIPI